MTSHAWGFFSLPPVTAGRVVPREAAACAQPCIRQGSPMRAGSAARCLGPPLSAAARGARARAAARPRPGRQGAGGAAMWG